MQYKIGKNVDCRVADLDLVPVGSSQELGNEIKVPVKFKINT